MPKKAADSEFRAYPWIARRLNLKGWNTRNPNRNPLGEVYTQNECLNNPTVKKAFGSKKPENVVLIEPNLFWIIEAKPNHSQLDKALHEAEEYANIINKSSGGTLAPIATGVAGTENDGFEVASSIHIDSSWHRITLKGIRLNRMLAKEEIKFLLSKGVADLKRPELPVAEVVAVSKYINQRLHIAKISKEERARIVAILLLALGEDPDLRHRGNPSVFIDDINSRAEQVFVKSTKTDLWSAIKISYDKENVLILARELNNIALLLRETDIVHAATDDDILGVFFESFLKYGNTSKELGIVLTPRHVCWLACEALAISPSHCVYDPAAGTGGFLIAAFNRVRELHGDTVARKFAKDSLYAAEDASRVAALAFINMYFRGDGKHNIRVGSCFGANIIAPSKKAKLPRFHPGSLEVSEEYRRINRILMNPPFALKDDDQEEVDFIDHGLLQLEQGGQLFSVLPASVLYERKYRFWREKLLEFNTLKAVTAFPIDLFYPVATESVGVFLQKGIPHRNKEVLWTRIADDGFAKKKGYRVEREGVQYRDVLKNLAETLSSWINHGTKNTSIPGFVEFKQISGNELVPHSLLGTQELNEIEYKRAVVKLYRGMAAQQWDQTDA